MKTSSMMRGILARTPRHFWVSISELISERRVGRAIREIEQFEDGNDIELQKKQIISVLRDAAANVPYYKSLAERGLLNPDKVERDLRFLQDIPIITKQTLLESPDLFLSRKARQSDLKKVSTSGSTGPKATIYLDRYAADFSSAVTFWARQRIKRNRNLPEVHLIGSASKICRASIENLGLALAHNRNELIVDELSDASLTKLYQELSSLKPFLIYAYPSLMYRFAIFCRNEGYSLSFQSFESSGEELTERMAELISSQFGCEIFNRYGMAEFGVVGYSVKPGQRFVFPVKAAANLEVLQESSNNAGAIIITGLRNRAMPLIRYDTGDLGWAHADGSVELAGRRHDIVHIGDRSFFTYRIQELLLKQISGVLDFRIEVSQGRTILLCQVTPDLDLSDLRNALHEEHLHFDNIDATLDPLTEAHEKYRRLVHL